MRTVLYIPGDPPYHNRPGSRYKKKLDQAISYYTQHTFENIIFLIAGRWTNVTDTYTITEAEAGKQYILSIIPDAVVMKEDVSVELAGNLAFSKPLIIRTKPDKVILFISDLEQMRTRYLTGKIFDTAFLYNYDLIQYDFAAKTELFFKEMKGLKLLQSLFKDVRKGDDKAVREILLYHTPYYFKGIIDDKAFFDDYWEGGYTDFLKRREIRFTELDEKNLTE